MYNGFAQASTSRNLRSPYGTMMGNQFTDLNSSRNIINPVLNVNQQSHQSSVQSQQPNKNIHPLLPRFQKYKLILTLVSFILIICCSIIVLVLLITQKRDGFLQTLSAITLPSGTSSYLTAKYTVGFYQSRLRIVAGVLAVALVLALVGFVILIVKRKVDMFTCQNDSNLSNGQIVGNQGKDVKESLLNKNQQTKEIKQINSTGDMSKQKLNNNTPSQPIVTQPQTYPFTKSFFIVFPLILLCLIVALLHHLSFFFEFKSLGTFDIGQIKLFIYLGLEGLSFIVGLVVYLLVIRQVRQQRNTGQEDRNEEKNKEKIKKQENINSKDQKKQQQLSKVTQNKEKHNNNSIQKTELNTQDSTKLNQTDPTSISNTQNENLIMKEIKTEQKITDLNESSKQQQKEPKNEIEYTPIVRQVSASNLNNQLKQIPIDQNSSILPPPKFGMQNPAQELPKVIGTKTNQNSIHKLLNGSGKEVELPKAKVTSLSTQNTGQFIQGGQEVHAMQQNGIKMTNPTYLRQQGPIKNQKQSKDHSQPQVAQLHQSPTLTNLNPIPNHTTHQVTAVNPQFNTSNSSQTNKTTLVPQQTKSIIQQKQESQKIETTFEMIRNQQQQRVSSNPQKISSNPQSINDTSNAPQIKPSLSNVSNNLHPTKQSVPAQQAKSGSLVQSDIYPLSSQLSHPQSSHSPQVPTPYPLSTNKQLKVNFQHPQVNPNIPSYSQINQNQQNVTMLLPLKEQEPTQTRLSSNNEAQFNNVQIQMVNMSKRPIQEPLEQTLNKFEDITTTKLITNETNSTIVSSIHRHIPLDQQQRQVNLFNQSTQHSVSSHVNTSPITTPIFTNPNLINQDHKNIHNIPSKQLQTPSLTNNHIVPQLPIQQKSLPSNLPPPATIHQTPRKKLTFSSCVYSIEQSSPFSVMVSNVVRSRHKQGNNTQQPQLPQQQYTQPHLQYHNSPQSPEMSIAPVTNQKAIENYSYEKGLEERFQTNNKTRMFEAENQLMMSPIPNSPINMRFSPTNKKNPIPPQHIHDEQKYFMSSHQQKPNPKTFHQSPPLPNNLTPPSTKRPVPLKQQVYDHYGYQSGAKHTPSQFSSQSGAEFYHNSIKKQVNKSSNKIWNNHNHSTTYSTDQEILNRKKAKFQERSLSTRELSEKDFRKVKKSEFKEIKEKQAKEKDRKDKPSIGKEILLQDDNNSQTLSSSLRQQSLKKLKEQQKKIQQIYLQSQRRIQSKINNLNSEIQQKQLDSKVIEESIKFLNHNNYNSVLDPIVKENKKLREEQKQQKEKKIEKQVEKRIKEKEEKLKKEQEAHEEKRRKQIEETRKMLEKAIRSKKVRLMRKRQNSREQLGKKSKQKTILKPQTPPHIIQFFPNGNPSITISKSRYPPPPSNNDSYSSSSSQQKPPKPTPQSLEYKYIQKLMQLGTIQSPHLTAYMEKVLHKRQNSENKIADGEFEPVWVKVEEPSVKRNIYNAEEKRKFIDQSEKQERLEFVLLTPGKSKRTKVERMKN